MTGIAKAARRRIAGVAWRQWLTVLIGAAVVAAMVVVAETARRDSERHLRAQVLVERVRAQGQAVGTLDWHAIAILVGQNRRKKEVTVGLVNQGCDLGGAQRVARGFAGRRARGHRDATPARRARPLQQQLIGRRAPANARLYIQPSCNRRAAKAIGPGDWNCNVNIYLPQPNAVPYQLTQVEYDVSVQYNGCYKAQSPPAFLGGATMPDASGHSVTNPLFIVYGCFNVL